MENSIDLNLRSLHGIGWKSSNECDDSNALSMIKAYVSFSGSLPNMKVSSFAMCFETGSLVIESNNPKMIDTNADASELESEKRRLLDISFADPFKKLSSNSSSSSEISSSPQQPHLQFPLHDGDAKSNSDKKESDSKPQKFVKFHLVFRSVGDGAKIAEGEAKLEFPETDFKSLPLNVDLPIVKVANKNSKKTDESDNSKSIVFDDSAFIRVQLQDSSNHHSKYSPPNPDFNEIFPSDKVDEIQLQGMVEKIHEQDCLQKGNLDLTKSNLFDSGNKNPEGHRSWALGCGGTMDIKKSLKSFLAGVGFRTKCTDAEEPELLTSPTMVSTIITRESLRI